MSRTLKIILLINLSVLAILVFVYPHLMVAPGKLIPGHQKLDADCFACHVPLTGASTGKCTSCHKPADIGLLTTTGAKVSKPLTKTPFHQQLAKVDCMACHSDHAGVRKFHQTGNFNHSLLKKENAEQCLTCHKSPTDPLHQNITANCNQCHTQTAWKPATFAHDKYFLLDKNHNSTCSTCHIRNDFTNYTCYGCHEHTPERTRRKHVEEGIRNFKNCVECHRSADEQDIKDSKRSVNGQMRKRDD